MEEFAREKGLEDAVPLLKKGALVAQDPAKFEEIKGEHELSEDEINAIRDEKLHKWRAPKLLYLTIATCSIGAAVQGWDQVCESTAPYRRCEYRLAIMLT